MSQQTVEQKKSTAIGLMKQRQYDEAIQVLGESPEYTSRELQELLELRAMCLYRVGRLEEAADCYRILADENPTSSKPLTNLGAVLNKLKNYAEAVVALRKAIQRDKQNFDAYYNLGFAHRHAGHPELAIPAYKEAIKLNPHFDQAHLNLANAYLDMNNNRLAITHYQSALTINPELKAAQTGLMTAQQRENQSGISDSNPFGRLVDVTQLAHRKDASSIKQLNDTERNQDREEVKRIAKGIRNASRHVSEEVRDKIEPALHALTRALIG
ncbi:MAG: tetratricopeptide repeat protein, partial [Planctomycetaceae bacterium]|nr:tetratricopeptide repeat protein [Planctomycetaceae bacterium]